VYTFSKLLSGLTYNDSLSLSKKKKRLIRERRVRETERKERERARERERERVCVSGRICVCVSVGLWVRQNLRDSYIIVWGLWVNQSVAVVMWRLAIIIIIIFFFFWGGKVWSPESVVVHLLACPAASRRTREEQSVCSVARSRQYRSTTTIRIWQNSLVFRFVLVFVFQFFCVISFIYFLRLLFLCYIIYRNYKTKKLRM